MAAEDRGTTTEDIKNNNCIFCFKIADEEKEENPEFATHNPYLFCKNPSK